MYSREERIKAMKLYLKYGCSATSTINELGYPSWYALNTWYKEYLEEEKKSSKFILWQTRKC